MKFSTAVPYVRSRDSQKSRGGGTPGKDGLCIEYQCHLYASQFFGVVSGQGLRSTPSTSSAQGHAEKHWFSRSIGCPVRTDYRVDALQSLVEAAIAAGFDSKHSCMPGCCWERLIRSRTVAD